PKALDAWFVAQPEMIDVLGKPLFIFSKASITSYALAAGPTRMNIQLVSGTTTSLFDSRDTSISALVQQTPAPNTPPAPPGTLAPGLKVFQGLNATDAGHGLCGALTVQSLSEILLPQDLALGPNACSASCTDSHAYTYCGAGQPVTPNCHSLLDVLVGGCKVT